MSTTDDERHAMHLRSECSRSWFHDGPCAPSAVWAGDPETIGLGVFAAQMADLTSHRIEGIARMGNTPFSVAIITQVDGNLWQGGCPAPRLPDHFQFVLNLYPWVAYEIGEGTESKRVELYDAGDIPDPDLLEALAAWVNEKRAIGPTLVHCQAGLNRSGLVAGLALVRGGMAPSDAIALLREKRSPAVLCNPVFETWLRGREERA